MDISTVLGLVCGFLFLILGYVMEGGHPDTLFLISPAVIVFGGTLGAVMTSYTLKDVLRIPVLIKEAIFLHKSSSDELIETFVSLSQIARKEGLLSLENVISEREDLHPLIKKGMSLAIDGTEKETIREILLIQVESEEEEGKRGAAMFEAAGGYSPTMGIIGTVMGLVHVLGNLSNPEELSKSIAAAFIATLYGVSFANLVFLPLASKLKLRISEQNQDKQLIIEGVLSIQEGESPSIFKEKLYAFVTNNNNKKNKKKNNGETEE